MLAWFFFDRVISLPLISRKEDKKEDKYNKGTWVKEGGRGGGSGYSDDTKCLPSISFEEYAPDAPISKLICMVLFP